MLNCRGLGQRPPLLPMCSISKTPPTIQAGHHLHRKCQMHRGTNILHLGWHRSCMPECPCTSPRCPKCSLGRSRPLQKAPKCSRYHSPQCSSLAPRQVGTRNLIGHVPMHSLQKTRQAKEGISSMQDKNHCRHYLRFALGKNLSGVQNALGVKDRLDGTHQIKLRWAASEVHVTALHPANAMFTTQGAA